MIFDKVDGDLVEVAFWAKLSSNKQAAAERQPIRGKLWIFFHFIVDLGKINCQTKNGGQTLHLMGANGCDLLENDWFRYHGTVDISSCSGINELKKSSETEDFY